MTTYVVVYRDKTGSIHVTEPIATVEKLEERVLRVWGNEVNDRETIQVLDVTNIRKGRVLEKVIIE